MNFKELTLYTIAKRPKDDLSDNEEYIPSEATIKLSLFKGDLTNCHKVRGKGNIVKRCGALLRLSECMRYLDVAKKQFGEGSAQKQLADFVVNSYHIVTEDFAHFVMEHQNDLDDIAETLRTMGYIDGICDVAKCANLRRHCTRNRKAKGTPNKHDVHVEYAVDVMDQYHRMVFHLYDMGLRLKMEEMNETKEVEDMGPFAVDKKLETERDLVAKKKKEFAAAAPDIVEESEGGNKFVIGGVVSTRECITDSICREIQKLHDKAAAVELEEYRMKNEFDSEIMEEDVGDLNDSNFVMELKHKVMVHSLQNLMVKIQTHRNELATGMRFKYWKDNSHSDSAANEYNGRVHPKFGNLKAEMANSLFMSTEKWNLVVFKAQKLFNSKTARSMKVNELFKWADQFDAKNGNKVSVYHFQCVCLYTDESDLCTDLGGSLRQFNGLESVESVADRNSNYYHLSRGLIEAVQLFGATSKTEPGPFYTGLSREFVLSSFCVKFVGPTSTSTEIAIALNFADKRGVVIKINNDTSNLAKCLNVSWCSRFPEESERLFMASRRGLRVASVILVKKARNFAKYFSSMFKLDAMLSRAWIKPLSVSKKDVKIIEKLCANQLTSSPSKSCNVPKYIRECFSLWCERKKEIQIQVFNLAKQYDGLSQMIMTKLVGVDDNGNVKGSGSLQGANCLRPRLFKMFPNVKLVSIMTREWDSNVLQYPIPLENFLEFMGEVGVSVQYVIEAYSDKNGTVATWLHEVVTKEVERKYTEQGWKIVKHLKGPFKFLEFKNVY